MAFSETGKIWMNGTLVDWKDATMHVATHALHYGSGVFEGIRAYDSQRGTNVFRLPEHMRRLWDSLRIYRMDSPYTLDQLTEAVLETIRANNYKSCYIRPLLYRGYSQLGVNPLPCPVEASIIVWEWDAYLGDEALAKGVDVGVSSWTRIAPNTFPAMAKATANYANSGLIKMQATVDGYAEGIALDESGLLSEGSGQNLFLVRDNVVYTPSLTSSILQGITRDTVLHADPRSGARSARAAAAARVPLPGGRGVLLRHRGRDHADPLDRQDHRRRRPARPGHRGAAGALLRHHQGRPAR